MKLNPFKPNPKSFKNTFCIFKEMDIVTIEGLKANYISESGSQYFYTEKGMYRLSNHWGRLANSKWRLVAMEDESDSKTKVGYANWTDFYPDNNTENLYYLEVDFEKQIVTYQHRNKPDLDEKAVLRTSLETTKRIKQARNILTLTNWAKYFEDSDINTLRKTIINQLIYTNQSLEEIKRKL
ncbi:hypothetical protein [Flavobacterium sp.]|uniref:hypothetical protein n=1 Tax=Flavobacterium sp. TaxID=239 RepID=UPI00260A4B8C|nr:hypothetical protein [Flavobacterium sp.]